MCFFELPSGQRSGTIEKGSLAGGDFLSLLLFFDDTSTMIAIKLGFFFFQVVFLVPEIKLLFCVKNITLEIKI